MVWVGPATQDELEIWRPVMRIEREESRRMDGLIRLFYWQGGIVAVIFVLFLIAMDDPRVALILPFSIAVFDVALAIVHKRAAGKRIRLARAVAEQLIWQLESDNPRVFQLFVSCPNCGAHACHHFTRTPRWMTRECLFCLVTWRELEA